MNDEAKTKAVELDKSTPVEPIVPKFAALRLASSLTWDANEVPIGGEMIVVPKGDGLPEHSISMEVGQLAWLTPAEYKAAMAYPLRFGFQWEELATRPPKNLQEGFTWLGEYPQQLSNPHIREMTVPMTPTVEVVGAEPPAEHVHVSYVEYAHDKAANQSGVSPHPHPQAQPTTNVGIIATPDTKPDPPTHQPTNLPLPFDGKDK